MLINKSSLKIIYVFWVLVILLGLVMGLTDSVFYSGLVYKFLGIFPLHVYLLGIFLTFFLNFVKNKPIWIFFPKQELKEFSLGAISSIFSNRILIIFLILYIFVSNLAELTSIISKD